MSHEHFDGKHRYPFWMNQADQVVAESPPASGTQYDFGVFSDPQTYVRIIGIAIRVKWTVQPTPLEVHLTVDGQAPIIFTQGDPVDDTWYRCRLTAQAVPAQMVMTTTMAFDPVSVYEAKLVTLLTAETTGGTVQDLDARLKWARFI